MKTNLTPWLLCILLAGLCTYLSTRPTAPAEVVTQWKVRTEVRVDTVRISSPLVLLTRTTTDTIHLRDTIRIDDTLVLPRQEVTYQDSLYRVTISGYRPRLDKLEIYPRTITHTLTPQLKPKRWGIGLQAGYGLPYGPYIGLGVSYNLLQW